MDRYRKCARITFAVYAVMMLVLLFFRPRVEMTLPYPQLVKNYLNYIPFHTIRLYLHVANRPDQLRLALVNLLGNILMFIPLGLLLPLSFPRLRRFLCTIAATVVIMTAIELLQMLLLVGTCDVDDLLLNTIGAAIGYLSFRMIQLVLKN